MAGEGEKKAMQTKKEDLEKEMAELKQQVDVHCKAGEGGGQGGQNTWGPDWFRGP